MTAAAQSETAPGSRPTRQRGIDRQTTANERTETVTESTLDRLTKLAAQRSARLDSLREACVPICELIAPLRQPAIISKPCVYPPSKSYEGPNPYTVSTYHQQSNVGGCAWTMIEENENGVTWTIDRPVSASGGWTHGDFGSPKPCGPTPRQLRDFAAWLADPDTLKAIADLEQETTETVDGLTAKLNAAAAALTATTRS